MGAITTLKQNNKPWTLTWKASGRYPIVADRIFSTLADAQAYVDDVSATASATGGLILSVISDEIAKNNGVYYVKSVANTDPKYGDIADKGILVKVGGSETETAESYSKAVELSSTLVMGQLIKVTGTETVGDNTYKAGFYIVETPGTISALDTSTGASDEIGALAGRVTALEGNRVLSSDFDTYKGEVTGALDLKVNSTDLETYKGEVSGALAEKATAADLQTLSGRVDTDIQNLTDLTGRVDADIQNLTTLVADYSGTLGDVDDRLGELEAFVEAHESIDIPSIEALFAESEE